MIVIEFENKRGPNRNNKPAIFYSSGSIMYAKNGELHREDGPALFNGYKWYYLNGYRYTKKKYYEKLKELNNDRNSI